jgi:hypothetical protein
VKPNRSPLKSNIMGYYIFSPAHDSHNKGRPYVAKYIGLNKILKLAVLEKKGEEDLLILDMDNFQKNYHKLEGSQALAAMRYFEEVNEIEYNTKQLLIALGLEQ